MILKKKITDLLVGTLLGDAHIGRTGLDKAFISFEQSTKKTDYLMFLHSALNNEGFSTAEPKIYERLDTRYSKTNTSLYFRTPSLEELKPIADMFLDYNNKKIIPTNISDYLNYRSLAFWIMDDGQQVKKGGLTLCTDSYNPEEVNLLKSSLESKFNISTSIHIKKSINDSIYNRIYIKKSSLDELKPHLKEHMHDSMLYKINEEIENIIEEEEDGNTKNTSDLDIIETNIDIEQI